MTKNASTAYAPNKDTFDGMFMEMHEDMSSSASERTSRGGCSMATAREPWPRRSKKASWLRARTDPPSSSHDPHCEVITFRFDAAQPIDRMERIVGGSSSSNSSHTVLVVTSLDLSRVRRGDRASSCPRGGSVKEEAPPPSGRLQSLLTAWSRFRGGDAIGELYEGKDKERMSEAGNNICGEVSSDSSSLLCWLDTSGEVSSRRMSSFLVPSSGMAPSRDLIST
mmetsp:Transcript_8843/g.26817  ORF Transcript_8843/g.26817 Transcript_8843/m.26817 type:complete len:224 (-) Transcript_8843:342-1013(-)